jgi:hypothetical protein
MEILSKIKDEETVETAGFEIPHRQCVRAQHRSVDLVASLGGDHDIFSTKT